MLGTRVDISGGLSRNSHIDRINENANRILGYICRNIKTKNQKVRETLQYNCPPSAEICSCCLGPPR